MLTRRDRFQETFSLDLRSLALLRMLLGLLLLVDLSIRLVDLSAHYTDQGILPREFHERAFFGAHPARFSFHMLSGELPLQAVLLALAAISAITLSFGFHTQASLLVSLLLCISIQNRNDQIETGGDSLLRLLLFWCLFLPLGARLSLDRLAGRASAPKGLLDGKNRCFSVAALVLILQMMLIYVFSALHKNHPIWVQKFTAIHYALHIDAYDTSLGVWLRQFPVVTHLLTRATLGFEFVAPWFLIGAGLLSLLPGLRFVYSEQAGARTLIVISFIFFHLGLGATLSLGTFAWFAAAIWVGLLPTEAWESFKQWRKKPEQASKKWRGRLESWARAWTKKEACYRVSLDPIWNSLRLWGARSGQALAGFCFLIVLTWNVGTLKPDAKRLFRGQSALPALHHVVDFFRLDQHWGLFAPYPRTKDGYYVVVGTLKDGQKLDLLSQNFELTWKKPDDVSGSYKTFRWRKYFRNLRRTSHAQHRRLYSQYLCRHYSHAWGADNELTEVQLIFMQRKTRAEGGHFPTVKRRIYQYDCRPARVTTTHYSHAG